MRSPASVWHRDVPSTLVPGCSTLLFQGDHDCLVPVKATREFHRRLVEAGARVVYVEYPQTEHAFDLGVLRVAPAAQNAMYHLDRFLALLV